MHPPRFRHIAFPDLGRYTRLAPLLGLVIALAWSGQARAAFSLEAEANPDPIEPAELLDVQISLSTTAVTGSLTLRVEWPEGLGSSPYVAGGGGCSGSCGVGEFLTWNLGTLGADTSVTVGFNVLVLGNVLDETVIPIEIELLESNVQVATLSLAVEVEADSPLELRVDPKTDPVPPSGTLVYEIVYGNNGDVAADDVVLTVPVPANTQFVSASGGGAEDSGVVTWNLGSLPAHSGGRQQVVVAVDPVGEGTLLAMDAAEVTGTVDFLSEVSWARAVSRVSGAGRELALEVNPDRVNPSQLLDSQVVVSNPGGSPTGSLTLRVLWPQRVGASPYIAGGGVCSGSCQPGEYLTFDLGVLGPNTSVGVGFNPVVLSDLSVDSGSLVQWEVELLEGGLASRTVSHTVVIQADSPLELAVDPLTDPVAPGGTLVYEVVYGNAGDAAADNVVLTVPVPEHTQYVSASGGGAEDSGVVTWNLGSLPAHSGGRQRITVEVDAVPAGTLLEVDAAELFGTVSFFGKTARARAVSRVSGGGRELALEVNPDRVNPSQLLDSQVVVSNPGGSPTGSLTLRVLWPQRVGASPYIAGGGVCSGSCQPGEYLTFDLGVLGPNTSVGVGFNPVVLSDLSVDSGSLVQWEVELLEGGLASRTVSHTVVIQADSPLELAVDPLTDPVAPGGTLVYEVVYGNAGDAAADNVVLTVPVPEHTQYVSASGGGGEDAGVVSWNLGSLPAHSGGQQRITVEVDAVPAGTLLEVDAAELSGTVSFFGQTARARAVSRVASDPLALSLTVSPNPLVAPNILSGDVTVTNTDGGPSGSLMLRLLWPEELGASPATTGGAVCSGSCQPGEYLTWALGTLGPGAEVTVGFDENLLGNVVNGRLIPLEFELVEAGLAARNVSRTALVGPFTDNDNDGDPDVFDEDDDNDGMPDWWEILYGLNPLNPGDADDDPDGDGVNNLQEYLDGTNPNVNNNLIFRDSFESG